MARRLIFAVVSALVMFSSPAFADKVKLIVLSDPAGATVYINQASRKMGPAPAALTYKFGRDFFEHNRCESTQPIKVRWTSGAEASVNSLQLCGGTGKTQQFVFVRPAEVPGRDLDVQVALNYQRQQATSEVAQTAWGAFLQGLTTGIAALPAALNPPTVNCTSSVVGSFIYTTCR